MKCYETLQADLKKMLKELRGLPFAYQYRLLKNYSVEDLESLATNVCNDFERHLEFMRMEIQNRILHERAKKMNDAFEWTDENRRKLLIVNEKFMRACEDVYNRALSIANNMDSIKQSDDDYIDIEINITPYLENPFTFDFISSEFHPHFIALWFSFGYLSYNDDEPIYLDRSQNWNIEYFGDVFKDDYICYAIHELLDRHWSFSDIINIERICTDIEITHERFVEVDEV